MFYRIVLQGHAQQGVALDASRDVVQEAFEFELGAWGNVPEPRRAVRRGNDVRYVERLNVPNCPKTR